MRTEEIRKYAALLFSGEQQAEAWLHSPARGLDYRLPIDVMRDEQGQQRVLDLLIQIDYGVYI
jgi:putative toxin-antitoxin system antitoxin component (TIGR02293 family)